MKQYLYGFCFWVALYLSISAVGAEVPELVFKKISADQGLSESWLWDIIEDRDGFVWFGADEGLSKYNGYEYVFYNSNSSDKYSISNNRIRAFLQDKKNN